MIQVKNLRKSFHGQMILNGINEQINTGEVVVVIGLPALARAPFFAA